MPHIPEGLDLGASTRKDAQDREHNDLETRKRKKEVMDETSRLQDRLLRSLGHPSFRKARQAFPELNDMFADLHQVMRGFTRQVLEQAGISSEEWKDYLDEYVIGGQSMRDSADTER